MKTLLILLLTAASVAQEAPHKFFDRTNIALFTLHAATTAWDAAETHNGINAKTCTFTYSVGSQAVGCGIYRTDLGEDNPLARPFVSTTPGQIAFFGGTVAANIGAAYLLHRSGHYKMERIVSMVNIGFSLRGASSWTLHRRGPVPPPATCQMTGACQF